MKRLVRATAKAFTLISLACAMSAQAAPIIVNTSDSPLQAGADNQGWWSNRTTNNNPSNDNYITRDDDMRSFFSFDMSAISGVVTSATFEVRRYTSTPGVTLNLFDVSTSAASLITTRLGISNLGIFNDLGSGNSYGSFVVAGGASTDVLSFVLNTAALTDINASLGLGYFSIGGMAQGGFIFSSSGLEPGNGGPGFIQRLVLNVEPAVIAAVPEPGTLPLLGLAAIGLLALRRRKGA